MKKKTQDILLKEQALPKKKFFLKWVDGWIKTISTNNRIYYIKPEAIVFIESHPNLVENRTFTIVGISYATNVWLDVEPKKFFDFLKNKP